MTPITKSLILYFMLLRSIALSSATSTISGTRSVPLISSQGSGGDEHIVIIDKGAPVPPAVAAVLDRLGLHDKHPDVRHVFNNSAFQGFAASMQSCRLDSLANMSDILLVEKSVAVSSIAIPPQDTRLNAPWGLQRISSISSVVGSPTALDYTYSFVDSSLGAGSDVYVIDTGIYTAHNLFNGRAKMLWSFNGDMTDKDGHGTHVAGTAAGGILGIASKANIYGIKSLDADGAGLSSNVVAGIDFVVQQHDARQTSHEHPSAGSVMSMSLASSTPVDAINHAVDAAISVGIHACVAAGNANTDACQSSPASAGGTSGSAITVGAVDISSHRAGFSSYGKCVDVYAPGVSVVSAWVGAPNLVNVLSGTSMATPHVTGIVACAIATNSTLAANPKLMKEWVRAVALRAGDGILLANNGAQSGGLPTPDPLSLVKSKTSTGKQRFDYANSTFTSMRRRGMSKYQ